MKRKILLHIGVYIFVLKPWKVTFWKHNLQFTCNFFQAILKDTLKKVVMMKIKLPPAFKRTHNCMQTEWKTNNSSLRWKPTTKNLIATFTATDISLRRPDNEKLKLNSNTSAQNRLDWLFIIPRFINALLVSLTPSSPLPPHHHHLFVCVCVSRQVIRKVNFSSSHR